MHRRLKSIIENIDLALDENIDNQFAINNILVHAFAVYFCKTKATSLIVVSIFLNNSVSKSISNYEAKYSEPTSKTRFHDEKSLVGRETNYLIAGLLFLYM